MSLTRRRDHVSAAYAPYPGVPAKRRRSRPDQKPVAQKSTSTKPFRQFVRVFLYSNLAIPVMGVISLTLLSIPALQAPIAIGGILMPPTALFSFFIEIAILLLHIVSTCWLRAWWPFRKVFLWFGMGGGVALFYCACPVLLGMLIRRDVRMEDPATTRMIYGLIFWSIFACCITVFLWAHRTFLDPSVSTPEETKSAQLRHKCEWARKHVREAFNKSADLISAHYTEADLELALDEYFGDPSKLPDTASIHSDAKDLVARIDSRRAYETIRLAYAKESEQRGGAVPWSEVEDDAEALLSELPLSEIREREAKLLTRIRQLSDWHRNRCDVPEKKARPVRTEEDIQAAIAAEVHRDAHPDDTEDDIEREIEHRLRGFRERCAA